MAELKLYTNPHSRGSIARWMLEEIGVSYSVKILDFKGEMKSEGYRAINPMGKVPALLHGDYVVTETAAICAYLAAIFPDAGLAPQPAELANYYRWLFFAAGPVEAAVTNRMLDIEIPEDKQGTVGYGNYITVVNTLEQAVLHNPYIAGERFTAADVYVGSHIIFGLRFGTLPEKEIFKTYADRLIARDAFQRANKQDESEGS